jgi:VWFA-related protein
MMRFAAAFGLLLFTILPRTGAQDAAIRPRVKPPAADDAESILDRRADLRIDTTEVRIPVSVTHQQSGKVITGLDITNFELYEDKVKQEILSLTAEDAPVSVGVVFDTSGSMGAKLSKSRQAVAQFVRTANPQDEFFLVQFNDRPALTVPFTAETEEILNRLAFVQSKGATALLDGVYLAMNQMKKARNARKAILIISDGGDNSSRYTESEVKNAVREADVQIYAIGIFEPGGMAGTLEERSGPGLLGELTEQTGGRHFAIQNLGELPDVAEKIGLELRNEYVIGYRPKNDTRDGKYRKVEVKLAKVDKLPKMKTRARGGYYAPAQ